MKRVIWVLPVLAAAGILVAANNPPENSHKRERELHKERIALLRQVSELLHDQRTSGFATQEEIMQAKLSLLRAELEAAETGKERIAVLGNIVEMMKEFEDMTELVVKRAHVDRTVYLKSKADRLRAEIDWERAKSGEVDDVK